ILERVREVDVVGAVELLRLASDLRRDANLHRVPDAVVVLLAPGVPAVVRAAVHPRGRRQWVAHLVAARARDAADVDVDRAPLARRSLPVDHGLRVDVAGLVPRPAGTGAGVRHVERIVRPRQGGIAARGHYPVIPVEAVGRRAYDAAGGGGTP